jgi:hypothetical protein
MNQKKKFSKEDGTNRFNEEKFKSIAYTSSLLSHCPSEIYLRATKRILRTISFGVQF